MCYRSNIGSFVCYQSIISLQSLLSCNLWIAGIQLHNVKFKDERILYELALQDQFVAYSGEHPQQDAVSPYKMSGR